MPNPNLYGKTRREVMMDLANLNVSQLGPRMEQENDKYWVAFHVIEEIWREIRSEAIAAGE